MPDIIHNGKKIPKAVIKRLSLYSRVLQNLELNDIKTISSQLLADALGYNPARVRKDLAYFGQFGTPGIGYHVKELREAIRNILGADRETRVALIGVGNLGSALLSYPGFRKQDIHIIVAFDKDKRKVDRDANGIRIRDISELEKTLNTERIDIVILTVPSEEAQGLTDRVVSAGIRAIMNFVPIHLTVPDNVKVQYVDFSTEMESLFYYLKKNAKISNFST